MNTNKGRHLNVSVSQLFNVKAVCKQGKTRATFTPQIDCKIFHYIEKGNQWSKSITRRRHHLSIYQWAKQDLSDFNTAWYANSDTDFLSM